jgi:hypothetical protein
MTCDFTCDNVRQVHIGDSLPPGNIIDFYNKVRLQKKLTILRTSNPKTVS